LNIVFLDVCYLKRIVITLLNRNPKTCFVILLTVAIYAERAQIKTYTWPYSMQARVMTWQPQCLSDALPPPQKGRDESEHTQVELV